MPSVISAIDYATPKRPCKTHIRPRARLHFCHPHRNPNRNPNANPNGIAGTLVRSNWQPLNGKWPCWLLVTSWFPIHFPSTLHFGEMRLVINPKFSFTRRHMGLQSLSLAFSICPLGQIFAHKSNTRLRRRMTSFTNSIAYYTRISSHLAWLRMLFLLLFNFPPWFYRIYAVPAAGIFPSSHFYGIAASIHSTFTPLLHTAYTWHVVPCCRSYFVIAQLSPCCLSG